MIDASAAVSIVLYLTIDRPNWGVDGSAAANADDLSPHGRLWSKCLVKAGAVCGVDACKRALLTLDRNPDRVSTEIKFICIPLSPHLTQRT